VEITENVSFSVTKDGSLQSNLEVIGEVNLLFGDAKKSNAKVFMEVF
jgi:hypothetical protein